MCFLINEFRFLSVYILFEVSIRGAALRTGWQEALVCLLFQKINLSPYPLKIYLPPYPMSQ